MHKINKLIGIVILVLFSDTFVYAIECPDSSSYVTDLRACESTIVVGERATLRSSNKQHSVPCVCDITTYAESTLSVNYYNVISQFCGTVIETQDLKFQCIEGVSTLSFTRRVRIIITNNGIPEVTWCMMFSQNTIAPASAFTIECYDKDKAPPELATTRTSPTPSLSMTIPTASTTIPAASTTIPAASTTIPAASTTIHAASTILPAASTIIPAASTTIPAAYTTILDASTKIPSAFTTIPAEFTTVTAATTTVPAVSTKIPAASTTIPATSMTISAASTTITAASTTIPVASTAIPAASTTIFVASTTIPSASTTIPAASTTIPAANTTIPAASSTIPATTTIPVATTIISAASTTIPAASTTIPAASTTIPDTSTIITAAFTTSPAASASILLNSTTLGTITSELTISVSKHLTTPAYSSSTEKDLSDSKNLHDPTVVYLAVGLCCILLLVATLISVYCYFKRNRTLKENPVPNDPANMTIDPRRRSYIDAYDPRNKVFEIVTINGLHAHTKDAQVYSTMGESNDNYDTDMEAWGTDTMTEYECTDNDGAFRNITYNSETSQTRTINNVSHIYTEDNVPYAVMKKPKSPHASHSVSFANMNEEKTNTPLRGILKLKETSFSDGSTSPDKCYSGNHHRLPNTKSPNVDSEYVQHMMYPYEAIYF